MNKKDKARLRNLENKGLFGPTGSVINKNLDKPRPKARTLERVLTADGFRSVKDQITTVTGRSEDIAAKRHTGFSDYRPTANKPKKPRNRKGRFTEQKDEFGRSLKDIHVNKGFWDMSPLQRQLKTEQDKKDDYYLKYGSLRGYPNGPRNSHKTKPAKKVHYRH